MGTLPKFIVALARRIIIWGDKEYGEPFIPKFYYVEFYDNITVSGGAGDLLDKYKIELLDWYLSKPIVNKFE